ncbi:MAG: FTR1 family protein [Gloeomargarita sp. SKYBB_i_bin120]|nr:FTR1 family protein [Gloeomargarita sp. SKYG98]MCS7293433.1 FTR1 family protein [Gloeomargarita sp. SKYB120]MDW8178999.1 FTR1 family protein [Gloeomargarita sp. SKYBB_i_bin120]
MSYWTLALPSLFVTLREGVEAALIVGIVLTVLGQTHRRDLYGWVGMGVAAGIGLSLLGGWGLVTLLQETTQAHPRWQVALEAGLELLAAGLLTWMLLWMTEQGRVVAQAVTQQLKDLHQGWRVGLLVLAAVLREGMETVVFIGAQFTQGWPALLGAVGGVVGAVLLGYLLFGVGIRLPLRWFFRVMGAGLLLIAAGLGVSALWHGSQALENLAVLGPLVWDTSAWLPDRRGPGLLLKVLLGYRDHLYLVQLLAYGAFLGLVGSLYYRALAVGSAPKGNASALQGN